MEKSPQEVAPGVYRLETGRGLTESNVYFVRSDSGWVLIDAAWRNCAPIIRMGPESLFGPGTRAAAFFLTHFHPDHSGSALELARRWELPVEVHPDELPFAPGGYDPGVRPSPRPLGRNAAAAAHATPEAASVAGQGLLGGYSSGV